jgi:NADPH:quinone reductase-like Zn-dependent oxidoreductase
MKAAVVRGVGQTPVYHDFEEPVVSQGENRISVTAAALSPLVKGRASGKHYSSSGRFPFVAGIDGVGRLDDGRRMYFILPKAPHGSMAERTVVRSTHCLPLPAELDDVTAAAIANPGMSSWAAYVERAKLKPGETVFINGATGTAGRLAVQVAKHLGAGKIIVSGRNVEVLHSLLALGANVTIRLGDDEAALEESFTEQFATGVHVVIDYLWGKSAEALLRAAAKAGTSTAVRFVQVGAASGSDITLPGAALRSTPIELMGSGLGSVPNDRLIHCIGEVLKAAGPSGFKIGTKVVPLSEVASAWHESASNLRTVFMVGLALSVQMRCPV